MSRLPIVLSVPNTGTLVPTEVQGLCALPRQTLMEAADLAAREIFALEDATELCLMAAVSHLIVDMNREADDLHHRHAVRVKTPGYPATYRGNLKPDTIRRLVENYYGPYHVKLSAVSCDRMMLGLDCYSMAEIGGLNDLDPGSPRPFVSLSCCANSCSPDILQSLADCLSPRFHNKVMINHPFRGSGIVRRHAADFSWARIDISRMPWTSNEDKRNRLRESLEEWCNAALPLQAEQGKSRLLHP